MKTKRIIFIILISIILLCSSIFVYQNIDRDVMSNFVQTASYTQDLLLNYPSGFYDTDLAITAVSEDTNASIYYTTDGSEPAMGSPRSFLYENEIPLTVTEKEQLYTFKFKVYHENTTSDSFTFTYVLGKDVKERYQDGTYIVSVTSLPENLFGYEAGVFEEGLLRDEYIAAYPNLEIGAKSPANYNLRGSQSERPVTVQIFDAEGTSLLTQKCGLRISGNYTRGNAQKSFQLFARHRYDSQGNFHVVLFPKLASETDGTLLDRSNRLLLRANGDDFNQAFIRDTLTQTLALEAGYELATNDQPAAVYLNGSYYGFYWLREPFSEGYLKNLYGNYSGWFQVLNLNEYTTSVVEDEDDSDPHLEQIAKDYQQIYDYYATASMDDDKVYHSLLKKIDVEQYLRYYALEIYIGNKDWPYNNVKTYRYVDYNDAYTEGSVFDGKYRYLLFDTDYSYHLQNIYESYDYADDNLTILLNNEQSPLFSNLMSRKECRDLFVNDLCDLMNSSFTPAHVSATIDTLHDSSKNELQHMFEDTTLTAAGVTLTSVQKQIGEIKDFASKRPQYMHQFITADFPVFTPYTLTVANGEYATYNVNTITSLTDDFTGTYYAECGLHLTAQVDCGHQFQGWRINDTIYRETDLTLSTDELLDLLSVGKPTSDSLLADGKSLQIQLLTEDDPDAHLILKSLHYQGKNDYVLLYNPSSHEINTYGLFICDSADNTRKSKVPYQLLAPGESMIIYGKKNNSEEALGGHRLSYNLKKRDTVILADYTGEVLQSLTLPELTLDDSNYVMDLYTGEFSECSE